jgi:hypothetical protein
MLLLHSWQVGHLAAAAQLQRSKTFMGFMLLLHSWQVGQLQLSWRAAKSS